MRKHFLVAVSTFAIAATATAQTVAGSFTPNPAPQGVPFSFTGTDVWGTGLNLPSPCGWYRIHQGSQSGPQVNLGRFCIQVIVPVPPNGTFTFSWDQRDATGNFVPPGRYWVQTRVWDAGFQNLALDWFCISIQAPGEPALTAAGPARLGQATPLAIQAPQQANFDYLIAASFSSNTPQSFLGLDTCLSLPVFIDPIVAAIGTLDANGNTTAPALVIPNVPQALWQGLHVQALLIPRTPAGAFVLTNDVSFTIQP